MLDLVYSAAAVVIVSVLTFFGGITYRKKIAESKIGSAKQEAARIINDALKTAETKKKESIIEAKEEILRNRQEAERDLKERRSEIQRQDRRIIQKEEALDKKIENLEIKEEQIKKRLEDAEAINEESARIRKQQWEMLEKISGYSTEQAKEFILTNLESELKHEKAMKIADIENQLKDESDKKAREIIGLSIMRCAADHAAEVTVSVVALPNDEMKGRIIGREGRNIRTLETMTGVDLIIDDTPEAITISSFDPIRREVARLTLERLIHDGRIHPAKIEEIVERCKKDVEVAIKQEGEKATFDTGVHGLHPELIKILGRLKYRTSYGQNVLMHSIEVSYLAGLMASELGLSPADIMLSKRAGLLHDLGKALDHEIEGSHVEIGIDTAKKYHENEQVIHAIHAHHGDVEPKTIIAMIVQASDAISASRPGARRENLQAYIKRLEKLEEIANSFTGVEKSFAIQAGREIRIIVQPEQVNDDGIILMSREICKKIESEMEYPGIIKVHIIRESRAIDYAK